MRPAPGPVVRRGLCRGAGRQATAAAGVELPICEAVADLLGGRVTVAEAMARLLARPRRDE